MRFVPAKGFPPCLEDVGSTPASSLWETLLAMVCDSCSTRNGAFRRFDL